MLEHIDLYPKETDQPAPQMPAFVPLQDLNIDTELATVYGQAKAFLAEVRYSDVPANQVAQVFNAISSILKEITKTQTDLYNAERLKRIEAAVIQAIKLAPQPAQDSFFTEYERLLNELQ